MRCFISSDDLAVLRFQNLRFCQAGEVFEKPALKPHTHILAQCGSFNIFQFFEGIVMISVSSATTI